MTPRRIHMNERGISVVLGSYNRKRFLQKTIRSIRDELKVLQRPSEIIVIDGGSTDGTVAWLTKQKDIIALVQHNRGSWQGKEIERRSWGYFMNLGFKCAQGKYICMLSDDCVFISGSLKKGYDRFEQLLSQGKKVGALAFYWRDWPRFKRYYVVTVRGCLYLNHGLYLRTALGEIRYINEDDYQFYCADVDLSLRLQEAGFVIEATQNALIEHCKHIATRVSRQRNKKKFRQDVIHFEERWKELLAGVKYCEAGERVYADIVPDDSIARRSFGAFYLRQRFLYALQYRFKRLCKRFS
ncbi:family 2 glycosyl transferase [candidate division KSB3 bacterium]|uniref:Family 2 glycosyl transferase n=1 Tax=candidate division KSB3 bacterium TaxID=2044937 RepID=A0A2G6EEM8_9BACT|nr:MAG: family 2 glycosyl transferase [candidate division KSB3 bacterium]